MDAATTTQDEPILLVDRQDGIATVTLNRPRQFNALSHALLTELQTALAALADDGRVRVVILAGSGKAFCAGHDLKEIRASDDPDAHRTLFGLCSEVMLQITRLPQPVIARVNGIATAAGCQLVATCDLAVATEEARFATSGINLGFFCGTPGVAVSRALARKHAMEMLLTGRFLDAQEALAKGLINRVVPADSLEAQTRELASAIAAKPPAAIQQGKRLFYRQLEMGLADAYAEASEFMVCNLSEPDTREGIDAFIEKRPPRW
jgi:enoyl-CoA hydratase/carnithine racemase